MRTVRCSGRRGVFSRRGDCLGGVCPGRWCLPGGVCLGGVCLGGVCLEGCLPGGVCPGGVCLGVVSLGVLPWGGVCPGGCVSQHALGQTHPPRGQNDRHLWKYYLAATTLRTVITSKSVKNQFHGQRKSFTVQ